MTTARIATLLPGSPADRAGARVGDELISVNGRTPTDIIEYQQLIDGPEVQLVVRAAGAALGRRLHVAKGPGEPLGLTIDSAVFDRIRTCDNHCTFCFIYQLPTGMRRSLYVKDDDYRLSFLYGNYTTLTRFTELDLERVIDERLSPLYVSVHTTDPHLRARLLRNPRGATSLRWLDELLRAGVSVHAQVVVCPGLNDGDALERTLQDIISQYPRVASVALVPLGISRFSSEPDLRSHTPGEARHVLALLDVYRSIATEVLGRPLFYASDEFYLVAGAPLPTADFYESLDEAENGIGMFASFARSFAERRPMATLGSGFFQSVDGAPAWGYRAARGQAAAPASGPVRILTGEYAAPLLRELLATHGYDCEVLAVPNTYFGGNIQVSGLLTGEDLSSVLASQPAEGVYVLPDVTLSEGRFLDGLTPADLPRPVRTVPTTGLALREVLDELVGAGT
ncbi:MAG: DUF512 domain-containing protein [Acidimicrobiales bacterium]